MPFRSLLAPLDLSPLTDRVLGRLARLPMAPRSRVTLLHVIPDSLEIGYRRRALREAKAALTAIRGPLLAALPRGVSVTTTVTIGSEPGAIAAAAEETEAELIVMGRGSPHGVRDAFLGSTAERVIRKTRVPVLAIRNPAHGAYRRPAIALDIDEGASDVISMLLQILPEPRPPVTAVHAYEIPLGALRFANLSEEDFAEVRDHYRKSAVAEVKQILHDHVPGRDLAGWHLQTKYGNPRAIVLKAVTQQRADLVALATHGYRGIAHAFLGTVAGDVLRRVACDVLIVPPRKVRKR